LLQYPSFKGLKSITLDLETHDPDLKKKGPGVRRDGYIVGAAVSAGGLQDYYAMRHLKGPNEDPDKVIAWLRSELKEYDGEILGANILYDMDYLAQVGAVAPKARLRDVQIAEPLIDETRFEFGLEVLAQDYLGEGKREDEITKLHGKDWKSKIREIDSRLIAHYAIGDLDLPERIHAEQLKKLAAEDLTDLYDLECRLMPMMLYMRRLGVRVDVEKAERVSNQLYLEALEARKQVRHLIGFEVNVNAADSLAKAFDHLSIAYPRTATGKPSFTQNFLNYHPHELCKLIMMERKALKTKGTFVDGYILDGHINGRIHCLFNQLKGDESGTVSGRFSSSMPNLQNIPARDEIIGPLMRSMFIPEAGCQWWAKDWSQIEFRLLVHYAAVTGKAGAAEAARQFHEDPKVDYHDVVAKMTGLTRKAAKNVNFGIIYGMGRAKMAADMGRTLEEADVILAQYDDKVPFAKLLNKDAAKTAGARGYIKTLLGRRRRFNQWETAQWYNAAQRAAVLKEKGPDYFNPVNSKEAAIEKWGTSRVRRAYTHKTLNAIIQGSAADLMKKAMVDIWEAGVCDVLPIHLTVHDELDGSIEKGNKRAEEALEHVNHVMTTVIPLRIPIRADGERGDNWADAK
jgi:DNA polymerase I-like protein with 3'-5' exonuclease and polymerase domains